MALFSVDFNGLNIGYFNENEMSVFFCKFFFLSDHRSRTDYRPSTALVHDVIHSMPSKQKTCNFFSIDPLFGSPTIGKFPPRRTRKKIIFNQKFI